MVIRVALDAGKVRSVQTGDPDIIVLKFDRVVGPVQDYPERVVVALGADIDECTDASPLAYEFSAGVLCEDLSEHRMKCIRQYPIRPVGSDECFRDPPGVVGICTAMMLPLGEVEPVGGKAVCVYIDGIGGRSEEHTS